MTVIAGRFHRKRDSPYPECLNDGMPSIHDFLYGDEKGLPWLEAHEVSETGFGEPGDPLSPSSDRFRASARTFSSNPRRRR